MSEKLAKKGPALHVDEKGRLVVSLPDGRTCAGVVPVRCFPFTAPDEWISLCEESGAELVCLPRLDAVDEASRVVLLAELSRREFIPVIRRVLHVSPGAEPTIWEVETDRGPATFSLPSEDNVRRLGEGALVTDVHGVRFRIVDTRALDARSRKYLAQYL